VLSGRRVAEAGDKGLLLWRFDRLVTVVGPHPGHGAGGWIAAQDGEAGQSRASATMTTNASNLDVLPGPRSFQNGLEPLDNVLGAYRHAEIWPIDVAVIPRWLPVSGEIQAIVGTAGTFVRGDRVKRRCCEVRPVRQHNQVKMTMRLEHAMLVKAVATLGRLPFSVPIEPAVSTKHNVAELDHDTTLGQTELADTRANDCNGDRCHYLSALRSELASRPAVALRHAVVERGTFRTGSARDV
jgi:hypothetical protein